MVGKPWTALAPLLNFTTDAQEPIPVLAGTQIRRLSEQDQGGDDPNSLFRFLTQQTPETPAGLPRCWALVGDFEQPWDSTVLQPRGVIERFARVTDALHLLHDEMVEFPFVMFGEGRPPVYSMGSRGNPFPSVQAWQRAYNRPYSFPSSETTELRELSQELADRATRDPEGVAAIAVGRLNATHFRYHDGDRIIDSAIALEAILLKGAEDELSYRQAIRGAHLLGGSAAERQETFGFLRKAYVRRSKIVHGAKDPGAPSTNEIVSMTRRIVWTFIEATKRGTHEDLIESLDLSAIRGSVT